MYPSPTQSFLGTEQAAIATLLSAIGKTQAAMTAAEVDLTAREPSIWGIAGAVDVFFNALLSPTVIGRLQSEDPAKPSAIIMNRLNSASGAACVQIAFANVGQVGPFVAASNWLQSLSDPTLGRLEVNGPILANILSVAGSYQRQAPTFGPNGRGTVVATGLLRAAGVANINGAGTVVAPANLRAAAAANLTGAGKVAIAETVVLQGKAAISGAGSTHVSSS